MPRFTVLTPVYNPPLTAFEKCVDSVLNQTFQDWEWIVVDDASTDPKVIDLLEKIALNPKIRVVRRRLNEGIVAASNDGLAVASGEFLALLDHDDQLHLEALSKVSEVLASNNEIDYLYTDEDKIDSEGRHFDHFRKPDWSPERLRSQNYCCHLSVARTGLVSELGGFRTGFDGSQDHDLVLRVTEKARAIAHVREVLYHWRVVPGSTAGEATSKPYALDASRRAVEDHYKRMGIAATVETTPESYLRTSRRLASSPLVSIVIPTRGSSARVWGRKMTLVETAVASIFQMSTYERFEVIVVHDHPATSARTIERLKAIGGERIKFVAYDHPFNFSDKCNRGAVASSGEHIIFLNDDTQIETADWIQILIGYLQEPDVGMVGPRLMLEDGRFQSAGHFYFEGPNNFALGHSQFDAGHFGVLKIASERSGLSMACAAVRRSAFFMVGGLSVEFPRSFNDVDFGNKLRLIGYRLIWTPDVTVHHFESRTRDPNVRISELSKLFERWGFICHDHDEYLPVANFQIHGCPGPS